MPVYNCEKTVAVAVESILNQTYRDLELIVVNDASTDGTKSVVESFVKRDPRVAMYDNEPDPDRFDVKLNRNINAGYSARNLGFKKAQGQLMTFQDADDASFLNRLEIQANLLMKYDSTHLTLDWIQFDQAKVGKKLKVDRYLEKSEMMGPDGLYAMSQRSKGLVAKMSPRLNRAVPFHFKRKRVVNKLFFGSLENYPGAGNSPLFRREVIEKVRFRPLKDRVWPSFMGRGADKDFNFQVAETFKNSHVFFVPLYMWRVRNRNDRYADDCPTFID